THHHWGCTATELTFGGRRIQVARPRVRSRAGQEAVLPAVAAWRERDPLTARVLEQILLGVSTRGYAGSLEAGPRGVPSRGTSKSAVSRALGRRLTTTLAAQSGATAGRGRGAGAVLGRRRDRRPDGDRGARPDAR